MSAALEEDRRRVGPCRRGLAQVVDERFCWIRREARRNFRIVVPRPRGSHRDACAHAPDAWLRHQRQQQRLLAVQPVLGLIEHDRRRRFEHVGRDFFVAVGRQAVHEHARRSRARASAACVT